MSTLEIVLIVFAGMWLLVLSLVTILVIRQIALISVRLDQNMQTVVPEEDGLDVGSEVPSEIRLLIPELDDTLHYVMLISATCETCRELAPKFKGLGLDIPVTVLVPGNSVAARELAAELPSEWRVLYDPLATDVANRLGITLTPFMIQVQWSIVNGKAYLHSEDDLVSFINGRESSDAERIARANSGRG